MVGLNYCLIVDLVDQGSLRDFLRSNRIDDEQDLIRMLKEISGAVEFLHRDFRAGGSTSRSSIAHRDIKSENILRYSNGTLVLCDFAMSIQIDEIQMSTFDHQQVSLFSIDHRIVLTLCCLFLCSGRHRSLHVARNSLRNDLERFQRSASMWRLFSRTRFLGNCFSILETRFDSFSLVFAEIDNVRWHF